MKTESWIVTVIVVAVVIGSGIYFAMSGPSEGPTEEKKFIGLASHASANAWEAAYNDAFGWYCEDENLQWSWMACEWDVAVQKTRTEQLVDQGVDGIVMSPVDPHALTDAIDYADSHGVPVITNNSDADYSKILMFIGFSNERAGERLGAKIVEYLENKYGEPRGTVVNLRGVMAMSAGIDRDEGIHNVLDNYPNITVIDKNSEFNETKALNMTKAEIESGKEIDAFYGANGACGLGAVEGIEAAGKDPKDYYIATIDAFPAVIRDIKEGTIDVALDQPALSYNALSVHYMVKYLEEGPSAIPDIGDTVTAEDVEISTGNIHLGVDPWSGDHWSPAEVVSRKDVAGYEHDHPWLRTHAVMVTKANADEPTLWGNLDIPGYA